MLDTVLESITAISHLVYYFISQLNLLLVCGSLLILFFMQKTPPFVVFGHKLPVIIDPQKPLWVEVRKYKKLAAIRWALVLLMVCLPLMGEDLFVDVTTVLISVFLVSYGYKVGFLLRLDGMVELGFFIKNKVMEVHLQDPALTFKKRTYSELVRLIDLCDVHEINTVTMKSPMFYRKERGGPELRDMERIKKLAEAKGWNVNNYPIKTGSISTLLASTVMFCTPAIRKKVNPFLWHGISLIKREL